MSTDPLDSPAPRATTPDGPGEPTPGPTARDRAIARRAALRRRLRRALVVALLVVPAQAAEGFVRLRWERLAPDDGGPLRSGGSLGAGLIHETVGKHQADIAFLWRSPTGYDLTYLADPTRGFWPRPNHRFVRPIADGTPEGRAVPSHTDRRGLRGADRPDPPEGALRVLVVGDSMSFGEGVLDDEAFPAALEQGLAGALAPRPVRVWNAGVVSYGPVEELATVEVLVPELRPDVVLWQFTPANDPTDVLRWREGRVPLEPDLEAARPLGEHWLFQTWLARRSKLWRLLAWTHGRHAVRYQVMQRPELLDRCAAAILAGREAARRLLGPDVRFGVLIAPTSAQVEGSLAETVLGTRAINDGLRARVEAAGVPVCEPRAALQAAHAAGELMFIPVDRHWTAAGHRVVAEALVPFVRGLVEAR